jgi:putative aldouronate transport system permease protein
MTKRTPGEKAFDGLNVLLMVLFMVTWLYPFIYVLAISLNDAIDSNLGGIYLFPRKLTLESYRIIFLSQDLLRASFMSIARTALGTVLTVLCSSMFAYTFTRPDYVFYKAQKFIFFAAMFLGGAALIPQYMLYRSIGILNHFSVYIFPAMVNLWFVILFRSYYVQLPAGLEEAAYMDGANELTVYIRILMPLSIPMVATIALFSAVAQWNSWYDTLFFANTEELKTLQFRMMEIMLRAESTRLLEQASRSIGRMAAGRTADPQSLRMAITIITTVPIVMIYPFLQRYFIKGMLVGSMKG